MVYIYKTPSRRRKIKTPRAPKKKKYSKRKTSKRRTSKQIKRSRKKYIKIRDGMDDEKDISKIKHSEVDMPKTPYISTEKYRIIPPYFGPEKGIIPSEISSYTEKEKSQLEILEGMYKKYIRLENEFCVDINLKIQRRLNEEVLNKVVNWLAQIRFGYISSVAAPIEELEEQKLIHRSVEFFYKVLNIFVRYINATPNIKLSEIQLIGVTCYMIIYKLEVGYKEINTSFSSFITDFAYTIQQVLKAKENILNTLEFNIWVPSPSDFFEIFIQILNKDKKNRIFINEDAKNRIYFLLEYANINFMSCNQPSIVALASIIIVKNLSSTEALLLIERFDIYQEYFEAIKTELEIFYSKYNGNLEQSIKKLYGIEY